MDISVEQELTMLEELLDIISSKLNNKNINNINDVVNNFSKIKKHKSDYVKVEDNSYESNYTSQTTTDSITVSHIDVPSYIFQDSSKN